MTSEATKARLEELRTELRAERISYSELVELQGLADQIEPGDTELLEAAGVPEFNEDEEKNAMREALVELHVVLQVPADWSYEKLENVVLPHIAQRAKKGWRVYVADIRFDDEEEDSEQASIRRKAGDWS